MDTHTPLADLQNRFGGNGSGFEVLSVILNGAIDETEARALLHDTLETAITAAVSTRMFKGDLNGQGIFQAGGFDALDSAIEWLLAEERRAAADLKALEKNADKLAPLAEKNLLEMADEALRSRCEALRDMRWELMSVRVEVQPDDRLQRMEPGSLERLRTMMGPN
jgi:hypothetical protein